VKDFVHSTSFGAGRNFGDEGFIFLAESLAFNKVE
jgi:hypothetical protein